MCFLNVINHWQVKLVRTVYIHHIFGDFPAKNTIHTLYICIYGALANPVDR